jgi:hypothetical protein
MVQGLATAPFSSIVPLFGGASFHCLLSAMTSVSIIYHFKDDQGYEDYALSEEERDQLHLIYKEAGANYSMVQLIKGDEE